MKWYKRRRPHHHRPHPESKIANKMAWRYGGIWWLVKKALLVLSAIADIAVIALLVINLIKGQKVLLSGVGIAIGILLMVWALGSLSKFRISLLRAIMVPVITAIYFVFFFTFMGLINI